VPHRLSQRNHAPDHETATVDGWHELQVANPTFWSHDAMTRRCEELGTRRCRTLRSIRRAHGAEDLWAAEQGSITACHGPDSSSIHIVETSARRVDAEQL
jgi:hypothetical protein